ncbi:hypothetical protein C8R47DRAFT_69523 [Mycena vitilis]|nr:hypothetical protein C8R47DRAFT_69523 [Mycena vitilis]
MGMGDVRVVRWRALQRAWARGRGRGSPANLLPLSSYSFPLFPFPLLLLRSSSFFPFLLPLLFFSVLFFLDKECPLLTCMFLPFFWVQNYNNVRFRFVSFRLFLVSFVSVSFVSPGGLFVSFVLFLPWTFCSLFALRLFLFALRLASPRIFLLCSSLLLLRFTACSPFFRARARVCVLPPFGSSCVSVARARARSRSLVPEFAEVCGGGEACAGGASVCVALSGPSSRAVRRRMPRVSATTGRRASSTRARGSERPSVASARASYCQRLGASLTRCQMPSTRRRVVEEPGAGAGSWGGSEGPRSALGPLQIRCRAETVCTRVRVHLRAVAKRGPKWRDPPCACRAWVSADEVRAESGEGFDALMMSFFLFFLFFSRVSPREPASISPIFGFGSGSSRRLSGFPYAGARGSGVIVRPSSVSTS